MRKNIMKKVALLLLIASMALPTAAKTVSDDYLVGVWVMESMQFPGESKVICGKTYSQVKIYGVDGEYACAEIVKDKKGIVKVLPHEYGKYSYKSGKYVEMGRTTDAKALVPMSDTKFSGHWFKRQDIWVKVTNMPKELKDYIVNVCKANSTPSQSIQDMMNKYIMNK